MIIIESLKVIGLTLLAYIAYTFAIMIRRQR